MMREKTIMLSVLNYTLWSHRGGLFFVSFSIISFQVLIALVWNSLGETVAVGFIELLPDDIKNLMESQFGFIPSSGIGGWLASLNRHPIYIVLFSAFAISVGVSSVAREIETGSILYVLSKPVSRSKFLLEKIVAAIIGISILNLVALIGLLLSLVFFSNENPQYSFFYVSLNSLLLFCTVNSIAVMISAGSEDSGAVTGKTTAVILAMYFIDFLSNVWPYVSPLGFISIFHYYQPSKIIENGLLPWSDFSVLIILAVIFYGIAIFVFKNRDISR